MIGTVHDEIIIEVSERSAAEASVILKETMVQPYSAIDPMCRSSVDAASHSHLLPIH